ncbi:MAG: hypothetical protein ACT4ON_05265 [Bacteroidota bacterium]
MKTKTKFLKLGIFLMTSVFLYTGCKKEKENKPSSYTSASDNSNADNAFAGIWNQISTVTDSSNAVRSGGCSSASITPWDQTSWPKTVVIDFGSTNCAGSDGNNRRGKITAVFSGPYLDSNTVITVTLHNYYHNDYNIQGTQTITNKGRVSNNHLVYNVVVNNATITDPGGQKTSSWSTNQDREFYEGYNTNSNIFDDVYLIRGIANGVSAEGEAYTIKTNKDIRVNIGCPWIVSGNLTLTLVNYPSYPIVADYGSGTCDANATVLFNGKTYNITMH